MEISLTKFSYELPIRSIQTVSKSPAILAISGKSISSARSIQINDTDVRYEAVSTDKVLVEIPKSIASTGITSVKVSSSGPVAVTSSVGISFSFEELSTNIVGISALVQRFLKLLLTSKNTSYQNMTEGGGVLSMVALADGDSLSQGLLVDAVTNVEKYMKDDPKYIQLPPSERLRSAEIISVEWVRQTQTASIVIRVTNQLGETLESGVSL